MRLGFNQFLISTATEGSLNCELCSGSNKQDAHEWTYCLWDGRESRLIESVMKFPKVIGSHTLDNYFFIICAYLPWSAVPYNCNLLNYLFIFLHTRTSIAGRPDCSLSFSRWHEVTLHVLSRHSADSDMASMEVSQLILRTLSHSKKLCE